MPNIKSAKKRVRVSAANAKNNKVQKTYLKSTLKKAELAVANGAADCTEVVRNAIKTVDQAAAKHIIHKNNAARKKSVLVKKLNG
ncbi:MAG: 30S ribosomal protein S20 [Oscillospiraceae bacterium]